MPTVVEFDFEEKVDRLVGPADAVAACRDGRFCWIDLDLSAEPEGASPLLQSLGVNEHVVAQVMESGLDSRYAVYPDCLHLTLTAGTFKGDRFIESQVEIILGEGFLVTLRRGEVQFVEEIRRHYRQDFQRFAESPGFLLYECWDHLIHSYKHALHEIEDYVKDIQSGIFGEVDDAIFNRVSSVTRDLLSFRKLLLGSREVLSELASRRSPFVPETTRPFLDRFVETLERLCADVTVEREILAETLNLYMGMVSHRTNKVVSRLTVISVVFLPLTFLCGVYGMNFEVLPELKWPHGYLSFWIAAVIIAAGLLTFMKIRKWW
jgi:magnesium transporter